MGKKLTKNMNRMEYKIGIWDGVPVGIGYFSVSFGFGALAASHGISAWDAAVISFSNLTSAGQFAGLTAITAGASLWELILTQLVINSRYALMSLSLGQKMGSRIGTLPRLIIAFFNTDEIFALAMARQKPLTVPYLLGLGLTPMIGWTSGTLAGALASSALPLMIRTALGVALYGMFIAIVIPQARAQKSILAVTLISLILSCLFYWIPVLNGISSSLSVILCTVISAAIGALLFPIGDEENAQEALV
jgi:predicted branched-subunit amino acid permease